MKTKHCLWLAEDALCGECASKGSRWSKGLAAVIGVCGERHKVERAYVVEEVRRESEGDSSGRNRTSLGS